MGALSMQTQGAALLVQLCAVMVFEALVCQLVMAETLGLPYPCTIACASRVLAGFVLLLAYVNAAERYNQKSSMVAAMGGLRPLLSVSARVGIPTTLAVLCCKLGLQRTGLSTGLMLLCTAPLFAQWLSRSMIGSISGGSTAFNTESGDCSARHSNTVPSNRSTTSTNFRNDSSSSVPLTSAGPLPLGRLVCATVTAVVGVAGILFVETHFFGTTISTPVAFPNTNYHSTNAWPVAAVGCALFLLAAAMWALGLVVLTKEVDFVDSESPHLLVWGLGALMGASCVLLPLSLLAERPAVLGRAGELPVTPDSTSLAPEQQAGLHASAASFGRWIAVIWVVLASGCQDLWMSKLISGFFLSAQTFLLALCLVAPLGLALDVWLLNQAVSAYKVFGGSLIIVSAALCCNTEWSKLIRGGPPDDYSRQDHLEDTDTTKSRVTSDHVGASYGSMRVPPRTPDTTTGRRALPREDVIDVDEEPQVGLAPRPAVQPVTLLCQGAFLSISLMVVFCTLPLGTRPGAAIAATPPASGALSSSLQESFYTSPAGDVEMKDVPSALNADRKHDAMSAARAAVGSNLLSAPRAGHRRPEQGRQFAESYEQVASQIVLSTTLSPPKIAAETLNSSPEDPSYRKQTPEPVVPEAMRNLPPLRNDGVALLGGARLQLQVPLRMVELFQGLMWREQLEPADAGMVFPFEGDSMVMRSIHMKNTLTDLDVIWCSAESKKIVFLKTLKRLDLHATSTPTPASLILEAAPGWAAANGVAVGDTCEVHYNAGAQPFVWEHRGEMGPEQQVELELAKSKGLV
ncbi:unnamed protein product [Amoebophrya sp. A120]|nr:unnamed protein product [Amoebophrya sp. A120]|eukprot:GSA120T00002773001.1